MTTRRWYYLIPAEGQPRGLVHAIERHNLDHLPGEKTVYAGRQQLDIGLDRSAAGHAPRRDGVLADVRHPVSVARGRGHGRGGAGAGVEIVSSGDLVQQFEAAWTPAQLASHQAASAALYRIKDRAFETAAAAVRAGRRADRVRVCSSRWCGGSRRKGWSATRRRWSRSDGNAGDPHYLPTAERVAAHLGRRGAAADLWGKTAEPGAVFADITWVGVTGVTRAGGDGAGFSAIAEARDAAVTLVEDAARDGRDLRGWEVDRAARQVLEQRGYGESHPAPDRPQPRRERPWQWRASWTTTRRTTIGGCCPGTGFTVEPGLYFETFGVRTEINVFRGEHEATVTGPAAAGNRDAVVGS